MELNMITHLMLILERVSLFVSCPIIGQEKEWLLKDNLPLSYRQQVKEFILQNTDQKDIALDSSSRDPYTGSSAYEPGGTSNSFGSQENITSVTETGLRQESVEKEPEEKELTNDDVEDVEQGDAAENQVDKILEDLLARDDEDPDEDVATNLLRDRLQIKPPSLKSLSFLKCLKLVGLIRTLHTGKAGSDQTCTIC